MKSEELLDLQKLLECEIIRFDHVDGKLNLLVVGDNEEEEHHHHDDCEDDDDDCDDGCCEGLNGHLFLLVFENVTDFSLSGEECDNYKTKKVEGDGHSLILELEGNNFFEDDNDVTLSFKYESFSVIDKGGIKGPDA